MGTISEKLEYLNNTKSLLKDVINYSGAEITNETTFRNYATKLYDGYVDVLKDRNVLLDNMPKNTETETNMYINNAEDLPVYEFELKKESSQETTTGKNIFNKNETPLLLAETNYNILETGIRAINTIDNTSYTYMLIKLLDMTNYVGQTIRLKCNFIASSNNAGLYRLTICDSNGENRTSVATASVSGTEISYVIPEISGDIKYLTASLYSNAGGNAQTGDYVDYTNVIATIDNVDMTYEEYTGGIPSPNPDYSQEIKTIKGYKNFCNTGIITKTQIEVTTNYSNGKLTINGINTSANNIIGDSNSSSSSAFSIGTLPAGTYNISFNQKSGTKTAPSSGSTSSGFFLRDGSSQQIISKTVYSYTKNWNISFTLDEETELYLQWYLNATGWNFDNCVITLTIVEGEQKKPYVPYGNNYVNVKVVGKNLLPPSTVSNTTSHDVVFTNNGDGTYTVKGTANGSVNFYIYRKSENRNFYVEKVQQTVTAYNLNSATLVLTDTGGDTGIPYHTFTQNSPSYTFTPTNSGVVNALIIQIPNGVKVDTTISIQQEKGARSTLYEPYKENLISIPLNNNEIVGIGNYKDELLVDKNGHIFINKKTGKVVLNGSEDNWTKSNLTYYITGDFPQTLNSLCSHFIKQNNYNWVSDDSSYRGKYSITNVAGAIKFMPVDENINTSTLWKNWLQTQYNNNTPVTVIFALTSPNLIDLDTTIDIKLFKGINNITNSEDGNITIQYVRELE